MSQIFRLVSCCNTERSLRYFEHLEQVCPVKVNKEVITHEELGSFQWSSKCLLITKSGEDMIRPRIDTSKPGIRQMGNIVVVVCLNEDEAMKLVEAFRVAKDAAVSDTPVAPVPQ